MISEEKRKSFEHSAKTVYDYRMRLLSMLETLQKQVEQLPNENTIFNGFMVAAQAETYEQQLTAYALTIGEQTVNIMSVLDPLVRTVYSLQERASYFTGAASAFEDCARTAHQARQDVGTT